MTAALTPKALARMEPGLIAIVDQLLDAMPRDADLVEDFAATIPIQIIGNLLDVPLVRTRPPARLVPRHPWRAGTHADGRPT